MKTELHKRRDGSVLTLQRHKEILRLLEQEGSVKTRTLCDLLKTSRETVRRDLETLEKQKKLKRIHGGAIKLGTVDESGNTYTSFQQRSRVSMEYKEAIAYEAAKLISPGQVVALDCGTTALALAKVIKRQFTVLTVVTNSLAIANELADAEGITLLLTGGIYSPDEQGFLSDMATLILPHINIDIFFITTCGISLERGITYQRMEDVSIQAKLMEASGKTIVITDSSKLGVNSLARMCGIEEIAMVVTDSRAPAATIQALEQAGIHVVISKEPQDSCACG